MRGDRFVSDYCSALPFIGVAGFGGDIIVVVPRAQLDFPVLAQLLLERSGEPVARSVAAAFAEAENLDPVGFEPKAGVVVRQIDPALRPQAEGIAINHDLIVVSRGFRADKTQLDPRIGVKRPALLPICGKSRWRQGDSCRSEQTTQPAKQPFKGDVLKHHRGSTVEDV